MSLLNYLARDPKTGLCWANRRSLFAIRPHFISCGHPATGSLLWALAALIQKINKICRPLPHIFAFYPPTSLQ